MRRRVIFIVGGLIVLIAIGSVLFLTTSQTRAASAQPIAFNHEVMVQAGIPCLYCHSDATKSPSAGMPSVQKCMGCHQVIAATNPEIQKLAAYWQRGEPVPWVRVNVLPRFVYFSHEVHVVAGQLACERCHGDVGHMAVDQPVVTMNMGWCLSCHEQQPNAKQLIECVTCHQ